MQQSKGSRVLARAVIVALGLGAGGASAQQTLGQETLEEITVTGSRIERDPNATAPLPVSTLDADDIRAAGAVDATAALRQIPALLASGTVADSIERGAGGVGQATLNLRQLGANRTLVLVDGYRHVSGVAGSQTVDVSTIPPALIERVDVLTGGASAVYGADAVTGVVNYILRRDFEGIEFNVQGGQSGRSDGESLALDGTWGLNFGDGRGNVTLSAGYVNEAEVLLGDRPFTANNGRANNSTTYDNPLLRFQRGDIVASTMPNFAAYYTTANGFFPWGFPIPTDPAEIATEFPGGLTAAERALVERARTAPLFAIGRDPRFAISSGQGLVFRRDFGFFTTDLNGNGRRDCLDSFIGFTGFGGGGCYVTTPTGVKVYEDGIVANDTNQFGGDGAVERTNTTSLIPGSERVYANLRGRWEFSPALETFVDAKVARNESTSRNSYNTFYDSLLIFADNPFIPAALRADATAARGLRVSRDFLDLGDNELTGTRKTYRIVAGLRGDLTDHLDYEVSANFGRTENRVTAANTVLPDRLFAAIDVITGPNGQPICRSNVDPTPHPGSQFFPVIRPGFFTFRPGDGQCRPANILGGEQSVSPEAVDFITEATTDKFRLQQAVVTASLTGSSADWFELPGGPLRFAAGLEYREEQSRSRFSDLELGLLPPGSPAGPAGTFVGTVSQNQQLIFDAQTRTFNTAGEFDVKEVFAELAVPLLRDAPFARELTVGAAARYADYSTIGGATTWSTNLAWAPVDDARFRGTYSKAIRAPDIFELFSPQQGATFRPSDPCNQSAISALLRDNPAAGQIRQANCRADGIPAGFQDPLTARFSGTSGGNPDLTKETATSYTLGLVLQPRWVSNLSLSFDYYSIEIEDAISAVTSQDIVNSCYDLPTFPNQYCQLFTRNRTAGSPTFLGFNFLRQTQLNFGRIETSGVDFNADYRFSLGGNDFSVGLVANWIEKLNRFFDPVREDFVNPGLQELGAPKWSGFASLGFARGDFSARYAMQYLGEQGVASVVQIERLATEFGPAGLADEFFVHNLSVSYDLDGYTLYGGVNNLTDEEPFIASSAFPVSGLGRFYFVGMKATF